MSLDPKNTSFVIVSPFAREPGHPYPFARAFLLTLLQAGYEATMVTTFGRPDRADEEKHGPARVHRALPFPASFFRKLSFGARRFIFTLACTGRALLLKKGRRFKVYDFVDGSLLVGSLLAFLPRTSVLYHFWADLSPAIVDRPGERGLKKAWRRFRRSLLLRAIRRRRFALVTDSPDYAGELVRQDIEAHCVPYSILSQPPLADPIAARKKLGLPEAALTCLLFGTHREDKDYDTVFRTLERFGKDVLLLVVGTTHSGPSPAELASRFPHVHTVIREGLVDTADLPGWFAACDLVVLPYRSARRGGSALIYDAVQFERPVVVTEGGFLGDFIARYQTGFTYRDGEPESLAAALDRFRSLSPQKREEIHAHLRKVKEELSWSGRLPEYLALFSPPSAP